MRPAPRCRPSPANIRMPARPSSAAPTARSRRTPARRGEASRFFAGTGIRTVSAPIALDELPGLFADFAGHGHVILAVSGGADSTAMMLLAARWREANPQTRLTVATIDHALRPESAE